MIAIDFGTSRIKLSYFDETRAEPRLMHLGRSDQAFIPSLFYLGPDGEREYGEEAAEMLEVDPAGIVGTLKRKLRQSKIRANRQRVTPKELLVLALTSLRERAGAEVRSLKGVLPEQVVLTFPARFGPHEEQLLHEAATLAGFAGIALVSEPEAAAIAWQQETGDSEPVLVVLDCGGGTVDWACLKEGANGFELLSACPAGGDEKVGGHDLDEEMLALIRERLEDSDSEAVLDDLEERPVYYLSRLRRLKERFSRLGKITPRDQLSIKGQTIELNSAELETLFQQRFVTQLCNGFKPYLNAVRRESGIERPKVLLVGGSGRVPGLEDAIREQCGGEPFWWERSEFATVLGAAYHGRPTAETANPSQSQNDTGNATEDEGADKKRDERAKARQAEAKRQAKIEREQMAADKALGKLKTKAKKLKTEADKLLASAYQDIDKGKRR